MEDGNLFGSFLNEAMIMGSVFEEEAHELVEFGVVRAVSDAFGFDN